MATRLNGPARRCVKMSSYVLTTMKSVKNKLSKYFRSKHFPVRKLFLWHPHFPEDKVLFPDQL